MHRLGTFCAVLALSALAACGGGEPENPVTCDPAGTTIAVVASGGRFDADCLAVPAGQGFTVEFTNEDSGFFHNFTVREGSQTVFAVGARPGQASTKAQEAMEAGTYKFLCTLHEAMRGTFIVG